MCFPRIIHVPVSMRSKSTPKLPALCFICLLPASVWKLLNPSPLEFLPCEAHVITPIGAIILLCRKGQRCQHFTLEPLLNGSSIPFICLEDVSQDGAVVSGGELPTLQASHGYLSCAKSSAGPIPEVHGEQQWLLGRQAALSGHGVHVQHGCEARSNHRKQMHRRRTERREI